MQEPSHCTENFDINFLSRCSERDLCFGRQSLVSPALAPSLCDLTHFQVDRSQNTTIDSGSALALPFNGFQLQTAMKITLNYVENSSKLYVRSLLATRPDFAMTWQQLQNRVWFISTITRAKTYVSVQFSTCDRWPSSGGC